jgi:hypothetical protein
MDRAERLAESMGISLDELFRELIELRFREEEPSWENDPFLSDSRVYDGPTPPDLVERFDDYLYGKKD